MFLLTIEVNLIGGFSLCPQWVVDTIVAKNDSPKTFKLKRI